MKRLIILTSEFPYGTREPFLEDELPYLSKEFDRIEIVPFDISNHLPRKVPSNVLVHEPVALSQNIWKYRLRGLFSITNFICIIKELRSLKPFMGKKQFLNFLKFYIQLNNISKSHTLNKIGRNLTKDDVVYSYWGVTTNLVTLIWREKARFISRFHGAWDLWEDSYDDYVPFREQLTISLDKAIFISHKGEEYFKNRYPNTDTITMPLGSSDNGTCTEDVSSNGKIRIVSCSTVYPLKRVDLIFDTLNSMTASQISWTHLGGGPDYESLKSYISSTAGSHIHVNLVGQVTHDDIMEYYKNYKFDVFINLSTIEGVPVSIMEAISFDIPVVATNVGGTSEVVPSNCGVLVNPNPSVKEISDAILAVVNGKYEPRKYWNKHYNSEVNYSKFANFISNL